MRDQPASPVWWHVVFLDRDQLTALVSGFKGSPIYEIVAMATFTRMRRGEILALRWTDLDVAKQDLRIQGRAIARNVLLPNSTKSLKIPDFAGVATRPACGLFNRAAAAGQ